MHIFKGFLTAIILSILMITSMPREVSSSSATTYTMTFDRKGNFVVTQDAYLPDQTIMNLGLSKPKDLFVGHDDTIYIADTGNRRILIYDPKTGVAIGEITHDDFSSPQGVFITEDNELYVADSGASKVFRFTIDGTLIETFEKPESVSLEGKSFNPKKVAVDFQDNVYIVAEGVFDGIIQLSSNGEFQGFFAINDVVLTPLQRFQNAIFSETQLDQLANRNPVSFSNVFVDNNGQKYSTSIGSGISNVKKHNTNGSSSIDTNYGIDLSLVDVYTDSNGIIYTASSHGFINIFTFDGHFIFRFGAMEDGEDVTGLYSDLVSIAVDSTGRIWTLDTDKAFLQSYSQTDYSTEIYKALQFYRDGEYEDAVESWEEVLKLNQLSVLAHNEIGRNLFSQGEYAKSLEHFRLAGSRRNYSLAYWEVRNVQIQQNLPITLVGFIIGLLVYGMIRLTNHKYEYLAAPKAAIARILDKKPLNDFVFAFSFYKHPLDSFYYLKKRQRGSYLGATVYLLVFFVIYLNYTINKGFIFQFVDATDIDLSAIVLGFFSVFTLFIFSNYLVTSINDGEGTLGEIYKGIMYSLSPLMISYLIVTYLSHYITYNEIIVLQLITFAGQLGTAILIFLAVQELHNYTIRDTIKSFLMTLLFMIIAGILFAFVQIMGDQLVNFVIALLKEVLRNVAN